MLNKIHYSWFICAGCTLLTFCTGGLGCTGFAAYLPYIMTANGLANVQISSIIFIRSLFSVLAMMLINKFLRKYEIRRVVTLALILDAIAFVSFAVSSSFIAYCISAALVGIAYGSGSMIPVSILISRWFNDHRGLALGICMAATGMSAFIASPIITRLVERFSLSISLYIEAGFIIISAIIVWFLLRSMPSCLDMEPLGVEEGGTAQTYAAETAPKALYVAMVIGFFLLGAAANNLHSNLSVLYQSVGYDSGRIASVISMFGVSLAVGKVSCGYLSDKLGVFKACMLLFVMSTVGCALCCLAKIGSLTMADAAVLLVGFGMSVASVSTSTYACEIATEKDYPKVVSRFQTMQTAGGLVFALIPGILADWTGDYILAYIVMLALIVISGFILQGSFLKIRKSQN